MFDEARAALGPGRYLVVGDRLDSDIAGGAAAGMQTALVLTGVSDRRRRRRLAGRRSGPRARRSGRRRAARARRRSRAALPARDRPAPARSPSSPSRPADAEVLGRPLERARDRSPASPSASTASTSAAAAVTNGVAIEVPLNVASAKLPARVAERLLHDVDPGRDDVEARARVRERGTRERRSRPRRRRAPSRCAPGSRPARTRSPRRRRSARRAPSRSCTASDSTRELVAPPRLRLTHPRPVVGRPHDAGGDVRVGAAAARVEHLDRQQRDLRREARPRPGRCRRSRRSCPRRACRGRCRRPRPPIPRSRSSPASRRPSRSGAGATPVSTTATTMPAPRVTLHASGCADGVEPPLAARVPGSGALSSACTDAVELDVADERRAPEPPHRRGRRPERHDADGVQARDDARVGDGGEAVGVDAGLQPDDQPLRGGRAVRRAAKRAREDGRAGQDARCGCGHAPMLAAARMSWLERVVENLRRGVAGRRGMLRST